MATRSKIGILNSDGTVSSVYCHSDGYPEHMAPLLTGRYQTEAKARELINLGPLSFLDKRVAPDAGEHHEWEYGKRAAGVTVAYHRDRGEEYREPDTSNNAHDYARSNVDMHDYVYLFDTGACQWTMFTDSFSDGLISEVL